MLFLSYQWQFFFEQGVSYQDYVQSGTDEQQRRWCDAYQAVGLNAAQRKLIGSFKREMNVLVSSGLWCGDCVVQVPMLARIAEASDKITLRIVDRDAIAELRDGITICAGTRVPMVILMAEDYEVCAITGDRSVTRYRAIAKKQLGEACETGLFLPNGDELAATLQDWLDEVERVQWMLRLSSRLRVKYGD